MTFSVENDDVATFWKESAPKVVVDAIVLNLLNPRIRNMQYLTFDFSVLCFLSSFELETMIGIEI